jgi:hypothetical protein
VISASAAFESAVELTPFHGHLIVVKQRVQDVPSQSAVFSAIRQQMIYLVATGRRFSELARELLAHRRHIRTRPMRNLCCHANALA